METEMAFHTWLTWPVGVQIHLGKLYIHKKKYKTGENTGFKTRSVFPNRFKCQAAAFWPSAEVRGQIGPAGDAGDKLQGKSQVWGGGGNKNSNANSKNKTTIDMRLSVPLLAGQQHDGRFAPGQRLPQRGEASHRRPDGPWGDLWHPVSQQRAPGHAAPIRREEVRAGWKNWTV